MSQEVFLGGVQLTDNIQALLYKNNTGMYWLSAYKDDKFYDFVTYGPEIYGLSVSPCGHFLAYYQVNPGDKTLDFDVWEYDAEEQSLEIYTTVKTPLDTALPVHMTQICFNRQSSYVIGLGEWNHVHVIDLSSLNAHYEFYIPNGCDMIRQQVILTGPENYFAWFGQDEYLRIIDLNGNQPVMWIEKLMHGKANINYHIYTKYFFEFNGYLVYLSITGTVLLFKPNLNDKCIHAEYDIKYPVTKCTDITIVDDTTLCFHHGKNSIVKVTI